MIIKLQDGDILTAQEDPDYEGVIHVPDAVWNHIVRETEHPDQEWVNSLYLDVKDLEIGGSGIPIVAYSFNINNEVNVNTYDMILKPAGQALTVDVENDRALVYISENSSGYFVYFIHNRSGVTTTKTLNTSQNVRYYKTPTALSATSGGQCYFFNDQAFNIFTLFDAINSDSTMSSMYVSKAFIDFLWIHN